MAAYRRVTAPRFLFAVSQLGLMWVTVLLCACATDVFYPRFSNPTWDKNILFGYPIPWLEAIKHGDDCWPEEDTQTARRRAGEYELVGWNPVVPVAALALAGLIPSQVVAYARRQRRHPPAPPSRLTRLLRAVIVAAGAVLAVAQVDILTDDGWLGVAGVPFEHPPGSWVQDDPRCRDATLWLSEQRAKFLPQEQRTWTDLEATRREWNARTWRTAAALGLGMFFACLLFRPWRRATGPSAAPGAAATTPPAG